MTAIWLAGSNLVVDPALCSDCRACVAVCSTGAIDNWRTPPADGAFSIDEQQAWTQLPANEIT